MNSRTDLSRTSLLAIALLAGAVVCLVASAIPVSVVSRLASFQNAASSVALDVVFSGQVAPALRIIAIILLLLGVAGLYWRRTVLAAVSRINTGLERIDHALFNESWSMSGLQLQAWAALAAFCAASVLLQYGPSLRHGYFAYDDFEMLAVQQAHPLARSMFLLHGDHTVPMLRAETAVLVALFGTDPLASNILLLTLFASTIFVGSLLLREMGTGAVGILVFVALGTSWMLWAEMLAGYYMISVYLQQLALSLLGAWAYLRWRKTRRRIFPFLVAFTAIISPFLDISGLWVPCAVAVFAFCAAMGERIAVRAWLRRDLWLLCVVSLSLFCAVLFNAYVFVVRTPGSFLAMGGGSDGGLWSALAQLFYFISGGLLATLLFPLGYWKLPSGLLLPFLVTITLGVLAAVTSLWPKLSKPMRWYFVAIVLIVLGNALIVVIGRPASGFAYPWQAKYAGAAFLWFCMVLAVSAHTLWRRAPERSKGPTTEILGIALVLLVSVQVLSNFLVPLFTDAPYGYPAYLKAAQERRRAVAFMSSAFAPLVSLPDARLPLLSGTAIGNRYPELVQYDLNCYRPFIVPAGRRVTFYDNPALSADASGRVICANARAAQGFEVQTAANLRSAVGPPFIHELSRSPALQELYLSPLPLLPTPCQALSNDTQPEEKQIEVGETDPQSISIRNGRWDPEGAGNVSLRMQYLGPRPEALAYFSFDGSPSAAGARGWIAVPAGPAVCLTVDLLQLYSYALSENVGDLNLQLATPGRYVIGSVTLTD